MNLRGSKVGVRAAQTICAASAVVAISGSAFAQAQAPDPVEGPAQGNWSAAFAYSMLHPAAIPQGINDSSCKPSTAHPRPVVLVNGAFESMYVSWSLVAPQLKADGYCVFGLNYGDAEGLPLHQVGDLRESAREVGAYVDTVLAATGAAKVDLVGHSEGGLVPLYFINQLGGSDRVNAMVGLAPITHGISAYGLLNWVAANPAVRDAVGSLVPAAVDGTAGSNFVMETFAGGFTRAGVRYVTIASRTDLVVQVAESQLPAAPNVTNVVLQDVCRDDLADHNSLAYDENVLRLVRNALDPLASVAPECHSVLPFVHQSPTGP